MPTRRWWLVVIVGGLVGAGCRGGRVLARDGGATLRERRVEALSVGPGIRDRGAFADVLVRRWVLYQSLGRAAAANDTLSDSATVRRAIEAAVVGARLERWLSVRSTAWIAADSATYRARYDAGQPLAARDAVFSPPLGDTSAVALASARTKAAAFRARARPATFAAIAAQVGAGYRDLSVLEPGRLGPEFERAIRATRPGRMSAVVRTPDGAHVFYRPTFDEVRTAVIAHDRPVTIAHGQRAYFATLDSVGRPRLTGDAVAIVKTVAEDPEAHSGDPAVIATTAVGDLTASRLVWWLAVFPPAMGAQVAAAPDSIVREFVRNIVGYDVMLRSADSAGVTIDSARMSGLRRQYVGTIVSAWRMLGVDPHALPDGPHSSTVSKREGVAARRVEAYLDAVRAPHSRLRFVTVPPAVERVVRARYVGQVDSAGVASLVARLRLAQAKADSVHDAMLPRSVVPMPGARAP